ncbi:MAG: ABC transporter permease [Spirochaetia bacterium]
MKISWLFFLSARYFKTKRREKGHTASILSVTGIAVGVMTLITVVAVMNGFQAGTIQGILEINSYHLQVTWAEESAASSDLMKKIVDLPGIRSVLPFREYRTLIRGYFPGNTGALIRAVPGNPEQYDPALEQYLGIRGGKFDFSAENSIVLGTGLAREIGVYPGETVRLVTFGGSSFSSLSPTEDIFTVTGIFQSGYQDFDLGWGFINLEDGKELFGDDGSLVWGIKLDDRYRDRSAERRIRALLPEDNVNVVSWRQYNRSIFGALRMEKVMMMVLIGLIFVVVGTNIYQSLRRTVHERTEEIGVLKAVGASPAGVSSVFLLDGFYVGFSGASLGTLLGLLVSSNINGVFRFIEDAVNWTASLVMVLFPGSGYQGEQFSIFSPAYFYLTEVPVKIFFNETLLIFLFALASSVAAAFFASRHAARIKPAQVLRYE